MKPIALVAKIAAWSRTVAASARMEPSSSPIWREPKPLLLTVIASLRIAAIERGWVSRTLNPSYELRSRHGLTFIR